MTNRSLILFPHEARAALAGTLGLVVRPVTSVVGIGSVTEFQPSDTPGYDWIMRNGRVLWNDLENKDLLDRCPLGAPGERLRCRETWRVEELEDGLDVVMFKDGSCAPIENTPEASDLWIVAYDNGKHGLLWRSPATMPAWASRVTLEVIRVRCVQTKDLTEDDVRAYGSYLGRCACAEMNRKPKSPLESKFRQTWCHIHGEEMRSFWDSKYSKRGMGWDQNPFVWAVGVRSRGI